MHEETGADQGEQGEPVTSVHVVPARAPAAADATPRLLFLVHGYGSSELEIAALGALADPARRFTIVAPQGPIAVPKRNGRGWVLPRRRRPEQFAQSLATLDRILEFECARRGISRRDIVVGGFSQGAILALALAALPGRDAPGAVISWSGTWPLDRGVDVDIAQLAGVPVLFLSGVDDEVIPIELMRASAKALDEAGARLCTREYDSGHDVSVEMLADTRDWLAVTV